MKHAPFIFSAPPEDQKQQRRSIKLHIDFDESNTVSKWHTEPFHDAALEFGDRKHLQICLAHCREADSALTLSTLKGFGERKWSSLAYLAAEAEEYKTRIIVVDDPSISRTSISFLAQAADVARGKLAARTAQSLANIKEKLARGEEHVSNSGRVVTSLGASDITKRGQIGNKSAIDNATSRDAEVWPVIDMMIKQGLNYSEMSRKLTSLGVLPPSQRAEYNRATSGIWYASTVRNIILRKAKKNGQR